MKKKSILLIVILVLLVALYFIFSASLKNNEENLLNENSELNSETPLIEGGEIVEEEIVDPVFCTMEVMECPDGSFVGRVAPTCEFAACSGLEAPIETEGEIVPELIEEPVLDPILEEPELIEEPVLDPMLEEPELIELTVE